MKILNLTTMLLLSTSSIANAEITSTASQVDDSQTQISKNLQDVIKDKNNKVSNQKLITVSYYSSKHHGRKTANGERFNMYAFTAAHKTLPFNTKLRITCDQTGKSVIVRVNDRGPYVGGRQVDLSYAAAQSLGIISKGVAKVKMEILN